jgi:hypothetical protein
MQLSEEITVMIHLQLRGNGPKRALIAALVTAVWIPGATAAGQMGVDAKTKTAISRVDPCTLLTKNEIQQQIELSLPASQRDALRNKGVVWSINMRPAPRGVSRTCQVAWQGNVNGETHSRGDFSVVVTYAGWLTGSVAGMKQPLPIAGLGDEAFFVGGKSGPPYARVGDIAIGIEEFPDTRQARSGLDLLRLAVQRVRAQKGADQ